MNHRHYATRHMSQRGSTVISALIGPAPGDTLPLFSRNDCVQHCGSAFTPGSSCLYFSSFLIPSRSSAFTMDVPEPDQSPFTAMTAHTSKLTRVSSDCRLKGGCDQRSAMPSFPVPCSQDQDAPENLVLIIFAVAIPSLPRCFDPLHYVSLGWIRCSAHHLLPAHRLRARMVHWYVFAES
jgi:hypothetical protein